MSGLLSRTYQLYKDSYSGHPKEIWTLVSLTFINRAGTMVLPFLTLYLTTILNFSLKEAGLLAAAFGIGSFAGAYIGELINKSDSKTAVKAAFGSFLGFLTSAFIKFIVAVIYLGLLIGKVWDNSNVLF